MAASVVPSGFHAQLYVYAWDIWNPKDGLSGAVDMAGQYTQDYIDQYGYLEATPEFDPPSFGGAFPINNIMTQDKLHFPSGVVIYDRSILKMTVAPADGQELVGQWWAVNGAGRPHFWKANKIVLYARRCPAPEGGTP